METTSFYGANQSPWYNFDSSIYQAFGKVFIDKARKKVLKNAWFDI